MDRTVVSGVSGNISRGALVNADDAEDVADRAVRAICAGTGEVMNGLVAVDLREDAGGRPMVTEINLRHVAATWAFARAGHNMVEAQILLALGRRDEIGPVRLTFPPRNAILRDIDGPPVWVVDPVVPEVGRTYPAEDGSSRARVTLTVGVDGARAASARADVVVVVDALRASSAIVAALARGMRSVRPVESVEECVGEVTAGERDGVKLPQMDFDNSPTAFDDPALAGKELVLTSTNGTRCIVAAASNPEAVVLVGALLNATAVGRAAARLAAGRGCGVSIVIAGKPHHPSPEDHISATEIASAIEGASIEGAEHMLSVSDFDGAFLASEAGTHLVGLGRRGDVVACADRDRYEVVPVFREGRLVPLNDAAPRGLQPGDRVKGGGSHVVTCDGPSMRSVETLSVEADGTASVRLTEDAQDAARAENDGYPLGRS
jgi:phosphosulfolactate phosphohydrolase-like enzyme